MPPNQPDLTDVDRDIVTSVAESGVLTTSQVARMLQVRSSVAGVTLRRLRERGLLTSYPSQADRRLIWQPTTKALGMVPVERLDLCNHVSVQRTQHYVEHQLLLNDVRVAMTEGLRVSSQFFEFWYDPYLPFKRKGLADAYAEYDYNGVRCGVFVNVDRDKEGLSRWIAQAKRYDAQLRAGLRRRLRREDVVVLIVTRSESKLARIRGACQKGSPEMFWLTTFERLHRAGFFGQAWSRPMDSDHRALLHS